jgi:predicted  nucleic acid-binding Zn-ribbon protein
VSQETNTPASTHADPQEGWGPDVETQLRQALNRLDMAHLSCKQYQEAYQEQKQRADVLEAQCEALERAVHQIHAEKMDLQEGMREELDRLAQALARLEGENAGLRFAISGGKP